MKEDIKYPYIGGIGNHCKVLLIEKGYGIAIEHPTIEITGVPERGWDNSSFKNITREYLANTCGKVVSKEHAEFIVELCRVNGIPSIYSSKPSESKSFEVNKGYISLHSIGINELNVNGKKLITIPLPPKQIQTATSEENEMSEFKVNINNNTENLVRVTESEDKKTVSISVDKAPVDNLKNNGDNLILGCEDSKCKEWPCENDEVEYIGCKWKVAAKYKHMLMLVTPDDCGFAVAEIKEVKKTKTPAEELRDDIKKAVYLVSEGEEDSLHITSILSKYNITKKPQ